MCGVSKTSAWALAILIALGIAGSITAFLLLPTIDSQSFPFEHMWVWFEDEGGVATIRSDSFQVAFEGHTFGSMKSGNYVVDGRYPAKMFRGADNSILDVGNGVRTEYCQQERLFIMRYQGHEIAYSHA